MYGPHFGPPPPMMGPHHMGPHMGPPGPMLGPHYGPGPYGRHPHDPVVCCCTIF